MMRDIVWAHLGHNGLFVVLGCWTLNIEHHSWCVVKKQQKCSHHMFQVSTHDVSQPAGWIAFTSQIGGGRRCAEPLIFSKQHHADPCFQHWDWRVIFIQFNNEVFKGLAVVCYSVAQELGMLPTGKDAKSIVIESHVSVDLFERFQGSSAEEIITSTCKCSRKIYKICYPPCLIFHPCHRGSTRSHLKLVDSTQTTSFRCGCALPMKNPDLL